MAMTSCKKRRKKIHSWVKFCKCAGQPGVCRGVIFGGAIAPTLGAPGVAPAQLIAPHLSHFMRGA